MFRRIFGWLDAEFGKNPKRWKAFLEILPGLLFIFQGTLFLLYTQTEKIVVHIIFLLISAFFAICTLSFWTIKPFAKKKYKLKLMWGRYDSVIVPLIVIGGFVCVCPIL